MILMSNFFWYQYSLSPSMAEEWGGEAEGEEEEEGEEEWVVHEGEFEYPLEEEDAEEGEELDSYSHEEMVEMFDSLIDKLDDSKPDDIGDVDVDQDEGEVVVDKDDIIEQEESELEVSCS